MDFSFIVSLYVSDLFNVTIVSSLWILYGNMVDFSFMVSLYVSDLLNVTTVRYEYDLPTYSTVRVSVLLTRPYTVRVLE